MKQYIVNLVDHLIRKNRYHEVFDKIEDPRKLVKHIQIDLEAGDVRVMSPAKLGEIMCSFEIGDIEASKNDIFDSTHFSGDCEEFLRELISLCLACAIRDRIRNKLIVITRQISK